MHTSTDSMVDDGRSMTVRTRDARPPLDDEHVVGVDELFFSMTNSHGVIESANSVFVRLSHYPRDELLGRPHNIIRHPDMPGGAFRIVWDRLRSGRPVAAYVKNLDKDGGAYWVFATITPLDDGFLSVRSAPCRDDLFGIVEGLYGQVRPVEASARAAGLSKNDAAEIGAVELANRLGGVGFASYDEFVLHALPAEALARRSRAQARSRQVVATGALATILDASDGVDRQLGGLLAGLDRYAELAAALDAEATATLRAIDGLRQASAATSQASGTVSDEVPVLARTATAMATVCTQVTEKLGALADELAAIRQQIAVLRFSIGLAVLHNDMVHAFTTEVVAGSAPEALDDVPPLCRALHDGVRSMAESGGTVSTALGGAAGRIEVVGGGLAEFQRLLATWRLLVTRFSMSARLGSYVAPIDSQLDVGLAQLRSLTVLGRRCADEARPFDNGPLEEALDGIGAALAELNSPGASYT